MSTHVPTKAQLIEVRSLLAPPTAVQRTLAALLVLLGYKQRLAENWATARKILQDGDVMHQRMSGFIPKTLRASKVEFIRSQLEGLSQKSVRRTSVAGAAYFRWMRMKLDALPMENRLML